MCVLHVDILCILQTDATFVASDFSLQAGPSGESSSYIFQDDFITKSTYK